MNVQDVINATEVGYDTDRQKAILEAPEGLMCEFGVQHGRYMKEMADIAKGRTWYGFDSFKGLPEDWHAQAKKGAFACDIPTDLPKNVELVVGLFQDTLIPFMHRLQQPFSFIHFDADLYSSTIYVMRAIEPWLHPKGTHMMFDQITLNDFSIAHEGRAMQEWLDETGLRCEIIGRQKRDGAIFQVWRKT